MRGAQKAHVRVIGPAPAWEEYARQKALRETRRDVYQKAGYLPAVDSLKMIAYRLHMPAPDKLVARLNDMPRLIYKGPEITLASPPALPQIQFCRYWGQSQQLWPRQA